MLRFNKKMLKRRKFKFVIEIVDKGGERHLKSKGVNAESLEAAYQKLLDVEGFIRVVALNR